MRRCRKCLELKPAEDFYEYNNKPITICKPCERMRAKLTYYANREKYLERIKTPEWRLQRKIRICTR